MAKGFVYEYRDDMGLMQTGHIYYCDKKQQFISDTLCAKCKRRNLVDYINGTSDCEDAVQVISAGGLLLTAHPVRNHTVGGQHGKTRFLS